MCLIAEAGQGPAHVVSCGPASPFGVEDSASVPSVAAPSSAPASSAAPSSWSGSPESPEDGPPS